MPTFPVPKARRSKRVVSKRRASQIVNLDRKPKRLPCLVLDSSIEGSGCAELSNLSAAKWSKLSSMERRPAPSAAVSSGSAEPAPSRREKSAWKPSRRSSGSGLTAIGSWNQSDNATLGIEGESHGPLNLCDLASDLREGVFSRIFPRTPGEFTQPCADRGVLLGTHLFKQHAHAENSKAAARVHVDHFAVQFASAHTIADAEA